MLVRAVSERNTLHTPATPWAVSPKEASMVDYVLKLPVDFDDYAWEVESKGWFGEAVVVAQGKRYKLNFYDPVRLTQ